MTAPMPVFSVLRPATIEEAVATCQARHGARYLAGGTDLIVNLRRGLGVPPALVDLTGISELGELRCGTEGARIGAGVCIARLAADPIIGQRYPALREAALTVAAPGHRNLATVGGNLCLDTRCIYYNQSEWWRASNSFCLKYGGTVCHVAPEGERCHAAFSGDLAPALLALGADVEIAGPAGRRRTALPDLYAEDGRAHLRLAAGELITAITLPPGPVQCSYAKVRIRGAFDFPLAGVAVALELADGRLSALRVALTGTNSRPLLIEGTAALLGREVLEPLLAELDKLVQRQVRPMRTTLTQANYRRIVAGALARRLLASLAAVHGSGA
jgi:4-hydroxybenzoyl-CoA reductase subunit beta